MDKFKYEAKLSVIVPVYNVMNYLAECLDSILSQTFTDYEVICVDDGSTDGSGELLDKYAERDSRIRVIHKENTGYGHSMNVGMDNACGEYIGIVESDDRIMQDFFKTLYDAAKGNDLDIVKSEFYFWFPSEDYSYRYHGSSRDRYFNKVLPKEKLWLRCQFIMNTWTGLYRRTFLEEYSIRHHESGGASFQDNGFWMQGMIFADRVMFLDYAGYLYRQDNGAASIKDKKKVYTMSDEYEWVADILRGRAIGREMDVCNSFRLIRSYRNLRRISDEDNRPFCDRLISDYGKYGEVFFRDLPWQEKFEEIIDDPDAFCDRMISRRSGVVRRIDEAESVIIYGAGRRGESIYRILCCYGWAEKLQCFVETVNSENRRIGRTAVLPVDDPSVKYDGAIIVISAAEGSTAECEMRRSIRDKGASDVLGSEELIDDFYMIC